MNQTALFSNRRSSSSVLKILRFATCHVAEAILRTETLNFLRTTYLRGVFIAHGSFVRGSFVRGSFAHGSFVHDPYVHAYWP